MLLHVYLYYYIRSGNGQGSGTECAPAGSGPHLARLHWSVQDPDVIVVGSGPNGLAAAITMAREGWSVLVVEAADRAGGGLRTTELTLPGFRHDVCSSIHPLAVASPFLSTLPLEEHGVEWIEPPVPVAHPLDGGRALALHRSLEETATALGVDGAAYRRLIGPALETWQDLIGCSTVSTATRAVLAGGNSVRRRRRSLRPRAEPSVRDRQRSRALRRHGRPLHDAARSSSVGGGWVTPLTARSCGRLAVSSRRRAIDRGGDGLDPALAWRRDRDWMPGAIARRICRRHARSSSISRRRRS